MAVADLEPGRLDIEMTRNNDLILRLTFNIDLTGWKNWAAAARDQATDEVHDFEIDDTEQSINVITIWLHDEEVTFAKAKWDLKALDPSDNTFTVMKGKIRAGEPVA